MIGTIKILIHQGRQYIPDVTKAEVPGIFRGRPEISLEDVDINALVDLCPTEAIESNPVTIDLGKCTFCGECAFAFPNKIKFTKDYKIATNQREALIVKEGEHKNIIMHPVRIAAKVTPLLPQSDPPVEKIN